MHRAVAVLATLPAAAFANAPHAPLAQVTAIAAGSSHTCAVAGGEVRCWGDRQAYRLGDGQYQGWAQAPVRVPVKRPAGVALGYNFSCARAADGVWCWGLYDDTGSGKDFIVSPRRVVDVPADVVALAASGSVACAGGPTGVWCWGKSYQGLGAGADVTSSSRGVRVRGPASAIAVDIGQTRACAVDATNRVWCWGETATRVDVVADAVSVAVGLDHTCALSSAGAVSCWGKNDQGQLGDGTRKARDRPAKVKLEGRAVSIFAKGDTSCAVTDKQRLACWGRGPAKPAPTVMPVQGVLAATSGGGHYCAITKDRGAVCWGSNAYGELGNGEMKNANITVPVRVIDR